MQHQDHHCNFIDLMLHVMFLSLITKITGDYQATTLLGSGLGMFVYILLGDGLGMCVIARSRQVVLA